MFVLTMFLCDGFEVVRWGCLYRDWGGFDYDKILDLMGIK
jgi:hypothetical protein